MEKAQKLHKGLVQKHERRLPFRVAAGMAAISMATALILSPVNLAMGKDTYTKKESRETEKKAPNIVASKAGIPQEDKKNLVPSPTEKQKEKVLLAQPDIDIRNLPKVPISVMKELDEQTEKELRRYTGNTIIENEYGLDHFYQGLGIFVPGKNWGIVVDVFIGFDGEKEHNEVGISVPNEKTGEVEGYIFKLDTLSKIYMEKNGSKMKYIRVIAEYGRDKEGDYITIHIVPVKTPTAPITVGTTAMEMTYSNGIVYDPVYYTITK